MYVAYQLIQNFQEDEKSYLQKFSTYFYRGNGPTWNAFKAIHIHWFHTTMKLKYILRIDYYPLPKSQKHHVAYSTCVAYQLLSNLVAITLIPSVRLLERWGRGKLTFLISIWRLEGPKWTKIWSGLTYQSYRMILASFRTWTLKNMASRHIWSVYPYPSSHLKGRSYEYTMLYLFFSTDPCLCSHLHWVRFKPTCGKSTRRKRTFFDQKHIVPHW